MLLLSMAGRNLSKVVHLTRTGTADYKGSKALKSCHSEFFQIRVRLLYREVSPHFRGHLFCYDKEGVIRFFTEKGNTMPVLTEKDRTFAPDFLNRHNN
jgi:hypothetical protein